MSDEHEHCDCDHDLFPPAAMAFMRENITEFLELLRPAGEFGDAGYYVSIKVPWEDDARLDVGPVETAGEIVQLCGYGCGLLMKRGGDRAANVPPEWHGYWLDEDGTGRELTKVEQAAFVAALEQAFGGLQARFIPAGREV